MLRFPSSTLLQGLCTVLLAGASLLGQDCSGSLTKDCEIIGQERRISAPPSLTNTITGGSQWLKDILPHSRDSSPRLEYPRPVFTTELRVGSGSHRTFEVTANSGTTGNRGKHIGSLMKPTKGQSLKVCNQIIFAGGQDASTLCTLRLSHHVKTHCAGIPQQPAMQQKHIVLLDTFIPVKTSGLSTGESGYAEHA